MITGIHHINFVVKDLDDAIARYSRLLDGAQFERARLAGRSADTAKTKVGETWLVLVQPTDNDGVPARHLAERGEGFFMISFATDHLESQVAACKANDLRVSSVERRGLDEWRVIDLNPADFYGVNTQLTQEVLSN